MPPFKPRGEAARLLAGAELFWRAAFNLAAEAMAIAASAAAVTPSSTFAAPTISTPAAARFAPPSAAFELPAVPLDTLTLSPAISRAAFGRSLSVGEPTGCWVFKLVGRSDPT